MRTNLRESRGLSLNRSQKWDCCTKYDTPTQTKVDYKWFGTSTSGVANKIQGLSNLCTNLLFTSCSTRCTEQMLSRKRRRLLAFQHHSHLAQCIKVRLEALTTFRQQFLNECRIELVPIRLGAKTGHRCSVQVRQHGLFQSVQAVLLCDAVKAHRRRLAAEEFLAAFYQCIDLVLL